MARTEMQLRKLLATIVFSEVRRHGWSDAELSKRSGVTKQALWRLKTSKGLIETATLKKLANGLGCRLEIRFIEKEV